jgi:hypothetical protein
MSMHNSHKNIVIKRHKPCVLVHTLIPALGKFRQNKHEPVSRLYYKLNLRPAWIHWEFVLKKQMNENE